MKIAYTHSGVRGISSYCLNLYDGLEARGIESLIVSEAKWSKAPRPGVFEPNSRLIAGIMPFATDIPQIERRLGEYAPDILHHHHPSGRLDFFVERIRCGLDVPLVVTVHICVLSRDYVIEKVMNLLYRAVRKNFGRAVVMVAISDYVRQQLISAADVPPERIVLMRTGVDTELYRPMDREDRECLELLFVGQFMPEKGLPMLIEAVSRASRHRKVRLRILGSGNLERPLRRRTEGRSEFEWLGYSSDRELVARLYAESDAVVMPTRWQEAFSYVPLEAMSCGTAVIASRAGGTGEAVHDGDTGLLFPVGDTDRLTEILERARPDELWEMGLRGREFVLERHTEEAFAAKHEVLYRNVLEDPDNIRPVD